VRSVCEVHIAETGQQPTVAVSENSLILDDASRERARRRRRRVQRRSWAPGDRAGHPLPLLAR